MINTLRSPKNYLLTSCPVWVVLSLCLSPVSPLKAMDYPGVEFDVQNNKHPLTKESWKESDLSERLQEIRRKIEPLKKRIIEYPLNAIHFDKDILSSCKELLHLTPHYSTVDFPGLPSLELEDLLSRMKNTKNKSGWSGEVVNIVSHGDVKFAIKTFKDVNKGVSELLYSLISLSVNPSPQTIKMARIYDAIIYSPNSDSSNSCLSFIMECANGQEIHDILSEDEKKPSEKLAENAIRACGAYFANYHAENHKKINQKIQRSQYLQNVASAYHDLIEDLVKEEANPKEFSSTVKTQKQNFELVRPYNALQLLSPENQEKFIRFAKRSRQQFERNCGETYRALRYIKGRKFYFTTLTHGDAHGNNFFYDGTNDISHGGTTLLMDSPYRVTMIDFASIVRTYGGIGDPAEDVGRFFGSLWDWAAQKQEPISSYYEKIENLQESFLDAYMNVIKEQKIFETKNLEHFQRIFKENYNLYKLRFYRVIANATKDKASEKDEDIKRKVLQSWIYENEKQEGSLTTAFESENLHSSSNNYFDLSSSCRLPDRSPEFIESSATGASESYLNLLDAMLNDKGTATLSSAAAIAGMGGVGKTSLALEYAHRAAQTNKYDLIYWIHSSTKLSLRKDYREILEGLGVSTQGQDDSSLSVPFKKTLSQKGNCLLIYDNVPDTGFLENKTPDSHNVHIIMTSRSKEGWENPLYLNVFRSEDSLNYLFHITGLDWTEENKTIAGELAKDLGHLPLALAHAAHYIKLETGGEAKTVDFEGYLRSFRAQTTTYLENRDHFKEPKLQLTYQHLIYKTLVIAKNNKKNFSPLAEKLLNYFSYLDPDAISEEIFSDEFAENRDEFDEALQQLSSLSLINREHNKEFTIHRLVQLVLRNAQKPDEPGKSAGAFSSTISIFKNLFAKNIETEKNIDKITNNFYHFLKLWEYSTELKPIDDSHHLTFPPDEIAKLQRVHGEREDLQWMSLLLLGCIETQDITTKQIKFFFENLIKKFVWSDVPEWMLQRVDEHSCPKVQWALSQVYCGILRKSDKSIPWMTKAAEQGYARAQSTLGLMYAAGQGVEQNWPEALKWFERAADQGFAAAQNILGLVYTEHKNENKCEFENIESCLPEDFKLAIRKFPDYYIVLESLANQFKIDFKGCKDKQDTTKAFKYLERAANQGGAIAELSIGRFYAKGLGVQQDYAEAIRWYRLAADKGVSDAQWKLGEFYLEGKGVEKNYVEAVKWFRLAADKELSKPQNSLGWMYANGLGVKQDYTEAIRWYRLAADKGLPRAQHSLGWVYANVLGVKDYAEAIKWYRLAADKGFPEAQNNLGVLCEKGLGGQQDYAEATRWYRLAADKGLSDAQNNLGFLYEKGSGVEQDYAEAIRWYRLAADKEFPEAQNNLGCMYANGLGVEQDYVEAIRWFRLATDKGFSEAQNNLGNMYGNGRGVKQDYAEAIRCYRLAADKGLPSAQFNLGIFHLNALGVQENYVEAEKCFRLAAEKGYAFAQVLLKIMYPLESSKQSSKQEHAKREVRNINKNYVNEDDRLLDEALREFELNTPAPTPKIIQQVDEKNWDETNRFLEEAFLDFESNMKEPISEIVQQYPENTPLISKPYVGKGKEEMHTPVVKKYEEIPQDLNAH